MHRPVAVVTGGSEGLGFELVRLLLLRGYMVVFTGRSLAKLQAAEELLSQAFPRDAFRAHQLDAVGGGAAVEALLHQLGSVDVWVNNAGVYEPYTGESGDDVMQRVMDVNLLAVISATQAVIRFSRESKSPVTILTVLSQAALKILENGAAYGTSKIGAFGYLLNLQRQLEHEGVSHVRLLRLFPGTFMTKKTEKLVSDGVISNPVSIATVVEAADQLLVGPHTDAFIEYGSPVRYATITPERFSTALRGLFL